MMLIVAMNIDVVLIDKPKTPLCVLQVRHFFFHINAAGNCILNYVDYVRHRENNLSHDNVS